MFMMLRLLLILLFFSSTAFAQSVRLLLETLPGNHPSGSAIFLAGSFNRWNPADSLYKFHQDADGQYFLQISLPEGNHEYKITRGSWDKVECSASGASIGNRSLNTATSSEIKLSVAGWQDLLGVKKSCPHSANR